MDLENGSVGVGVWNKLFFGGVMLNREGELFGGGIIGNFLKGCGLKSIFLFGKIDFFLEVI